MTWRDDPGRELHNALQEWSSAPGRRASVERVVAATSCIASIRAAGERIGATGGTADDWRAIAAADDHGSWPQIDALARSAVTRPDLHLTREMLRLRRGGANVLALEHRGARVTWDRGCLAIGATPVTKGGEHRLIDDLSVGGVGGALAWLDGAPPEPESGSVGLLLHHHSFGNYYHWLLEALRGAILLDDSGQLATLRRLIFCVPDPAPKFMRQTLDAVGLPSDLVQVCTAPFDRTFERLFITTPHHVFRGLPIDEYSRRLRERLGSRRPGPMRRILISRGDADQRRVTNERDLASALADHGVEVVRPGDLSFTEQVALFASAELIVAPHGAALANLIFCEIGTSVIEFRSAQLDRPWFERLSGALGLRYTAISTPTDAASPRDFRVDVAAATELVETTLQLA